MNRSRFGQSGALGIKAQVFVEQHRRHIGHAHRHARMARIGGGHGIQRQHADRAAFFQWSGCWARRVAMSKAIDPSDPGRGVRPLNTQPERQDQARPATRWAERPRKRFCLSANIEEDRPVPDSPSRKRGKNVPQWRNQAIFGGNRQMSDIHELEAPDHCGAGTDRPGGRTAIAQRSMRLPQLPTMTGRLSALAEELAGGARCQCPAARTPARC